MDRGVFAGKDSESSLLQVFTAAFIELQKNWAAAQDRRDEMYEKRNLALVDAITHLALVITALNDNTLQHTTEMTDAVAEMHRTSDNLLAAVKEATRPIARPLKKTAQ